MKLKQAGPAILIVLVVATILAAGCTGPAQNPAVNTSPTVFPGETNAIAPVTTTNPSGSNSATQAVSAGNNRFAFDLYGVLSSTPAGAGQNIFYSPFSISSALAITGEGAKGTTADEINSVFHFPANATVRREGFLQINKGFNAADAGYTLRTANALWAEKNYSFLPSFTSIAGTYYSANVTNLDFVHAPEESRVIINTWVEEKTEKKIRDLLPAGSIDSLTRLVITNAVYFKGTWVRQFDAARTQDADFLTETGKTVNVKMMQDTGSEAEYRYAETNSVQYIELPYTHESGKALSMAVILPKDKDLQTAEAVLDESNLSALNDAAYVQRVMVYLPKFKMETEYRLPDTLSAMGMPTAFTFGAADFSGMDGTTDLYISDVIHKAFIDVNEEGTEAAAATAVVMRAGAAAPGEDPPVFRADHPFVFLIRDDETGTILFIGRVADPSGS